MVNKNKISVLVGRCAALLGMGLGEEEFLFRVAGLVRGLSDAECRALLRALARSGVVIPVTFN